MGRLFWKILFGFWLTLLVTVTAVGTLVWWLHSERIHELEMQLQSPRAEMQVSRFADILQYGGEPAVIDRLQQQARLEQRPPAVFVINDAGHDILDRPVPAPILEQAKQALASAETSAVQQVVTEQGRHYLLFMAHPEHRREKSPPLLRREPVFALTALLLASLLFSAGLAWYLTRPVRVLRNATNRLAEGELNTRVMPHMGGRRDEIADLGQDFDRMAEKIQSLISAQKDLLNDVSHELRSPLARLQVAIEMSRQQPERVSELLTRAEKESNRLDELVGEVLTLSRLEAGVLENERDYFDIAGLIEAICSDANFEAEQQHKEVIFNGEQEILIAGHIELVRRAIENIVRNALFHTPEHSQVIIKLVREQNEVVITVCDSGDGVPEEKLEKLFQPFVRIKESTQNTRVPGYGLGLAIARRAIEMHRGSIKASNQQEGGLCFTIKLKGAN